MASGKKGGKGKQKKKKDGTKEKTDELEIICYNCNRPGHKQFECWAEGGGKEGQGPRQKKSAKAQKAVMAIADNDKDELFAFTCTSNYANVAENLQVPKSKLGSCIDSGASEVYCPDWEKFANYKLIDQSITVRATAESDLTEF